MKTRLPALVVLVAAFLAGGYPSSVAAYLAAAWALVSAIDRDWQLPAVTGAAMTCAGSLTGTGRSFRHGLAVAGLGLAVGVALLVDTVAGYA